MTSESLVAKDSEKRPDIRNIEEAELSLCESSSLNFEVCFLSDFKLVSGVVLFAIDDFQLSCVYFFYN